MASMGNNETDEESVSSSLSLHTTNRSDDSNNQQECHNIVKSLRRRKTSTVIRRSRLVTTAIRNGNDDASTTTTTIISNNTVQLSEQKDTAEIQDADTRSVSFLCGITAGILQAGIFNPFDRALYLSITNNVSFLRRENFRKPYTGFFQSVGHRAVSSGLYYPLENIFCSLLLSSRCHPDACDEETNLNSGIIHLHPAFGNFLAGTFAGTANALIVNPITAIKYKSWGREVNRGMVTEATEMFRKGGLRPFGNGLLPTVLRDLCFGGTYTFLRLELQFLFQIPAEQQWIANMSAAAMATIVSAPFNLVRNVQYATRSREKADTISTVLRDFMTETHRQQSAWKRTRFVQNRLRIGWGTVRVAIGMAFGHFVYDNLMGIYEDYDSSN